MDLHIHMYTHTLHPYMHTHTYSHTHVDTYAVCFRLIWSVGFSKRSDSVKREVLSCDTEVLSGETLFHWIGPLDVSLENWSFLVMSGAS